MAKPAADRRPADNPREEPQALPATLWGGWRRGEGTWILRSDFCFRGGSGAERAGLGAALFDPDGQWVASASERVDPDTLGRGGPRVQLGESLALLRGLELAREVCPGQRLLALVDSQAVLDSLRDGQDRSRWSPMGRALANQIRGQIAKLPEGSVATWMPREGNRLADALSVRAATPALPAASQRKADQSARARLVALAEIDVLWTELAPARDSAAYVSEGKLLPLSGRQGDGVDRGLSFGEFARLAALMLSPEHRQALGGATLFERQETVPAPLPPPGSRKRKAASHHSFSRKRFVA
jgi:hypothetical protein